MFFNSLLSPDAEPRKRPRQRRSQETVDRILDAAARIFEERGYHSTTTNHVAGAAEISIGSLYQYFPNKDALLVALAERHLDEASTVLGELTGALRVSQPPLEDLCAVLVHAVIALNSPDPLYRLLWEAPRTAALMERYRRFDEAIGAEVAWHLARFGHDEGRARRRAEILVTAVSAAVHTCEQGDDLADELIRMCVNYAACP